MTALYIISGITAFFAALFSFNISLRVIFSSSKKEEINVYAKIGFYKIHITPAKQKKRKRKARQKKEKPAKPVKEKKSPPKEKEQQKYSVPEIFEFIKGLGSVLLKRFKRHFKVKIYGINVVLASEEAEKTAVLYGAAIQSAYYLNEFLTHNFKIKKNNESIKIIPDFSKTKTEFEINVKFYIRISHILALLIASGIKFLKFQQKSKKIKTGE